MGSDLAFEFARRESSVHMQMDHPNIVKCFNYSESSERFYLFMEYAGYGSNYLEKKIHFDHKSIKEEKIQIWSQDILNAIWYIHKRGVIHTDIKISNILIQAKTEEQRA